MNLQIFLQSRWGKVFFVVASLLLTSFSLALVIQTLTKRGEDELSPPKPPILTSLTTSVDSWKKNLENPYKENTKDEKEKDKWKKWDDWKKEVKKEFWAFYFVLETNSCSYFGSSYCHGEKINDDEEKLIKLSLIVAKENHYPHNFSNFQWMETYEKKHLQRVDRYNFDVEVYYDDVFLTSFLKRSFPNSSTPNIFKNKHEWLGRGKYIYFSEPFTSVTVTNLSTSDIFTDKTSLKVNKESSLLKNEKEKEKKGPHRKRGRCRFLGYPKGCN